VATFARRLVMRASEYMQGGLIPVVWLLLSLTIATAAFGWAKRPDTTVPQPASGYVEVDFTHGHPALSPVTVVVTLSRDQDSPVGGGGTTMTIELAGDDLRHVGWSVAADVPSGVEVITGRPYHPYTSQGMSYLAIAPGPQLGGTYEAVLEWNNLASGPLQVTGATMAAALPRVVVINQTKTESEHVPMPSATVKEALIPGGDFTYQSGPVPTRLVGYEWQWKPETGNVNNTELASGFTVEAKSALLDGQDHVTEFYSGIAFGISAAAGITCLVEFVKADRRKRHPAPAEDNDGAGDLLLPD
jgi:hypothetical protein